MCNRPRAPGRSPSTVEQTCHLAGRLPAYLASAEDCLALGSEPPPTTRRSQRLARTQRPSWLPLPHAKRRTASANRPFYNCPSHHHCLSRSSSSGRLAQIASTSSGRTLRMANLSILALSQSNPSAEDGWRTLSPTASCLTLCSASASQYTRRQGAAHNVHARGPCRGRERKALRHRRLLELHRRPSVPCRASSFHRRCIPACPVASHQSAALAPSRPHRRERTVSASRTNARAL